MSAVSMWARSVWAWDSPRTTGTQAAKARMPSIATAMSRAGSTPWWTLLMPMILFWIDEFPARLRATEYAIQSTHHRVVSR